MTAGSSSGTLEGAITALVTPFAEDGTLDEPMLERLVHFQLERGIDALAPCGTTGEAATLTPDERRRVVSTVVRVVDGRVPVVAGCGSNDTRATVEAARIVADAGADALLVVSPYYNKPNRSGLLAHYAAVARATDLPVVVYNVPGRTGQNLGAELILELARMPGIVAVKEASGDLDQIASIIAGRPPGFAVLGGDDALTLPAIALGAEGVVSVVSNEAPGSMARLVERARSGDLEGARELHYRLLPLMRANFAESNPVPAKVALALLGLCRETVRLPLAEASDRTRQLVERALRDAGVVSSAR